LSLSPSCLTLLYSAYWYSEKTNGDVLYNMNNGITNETIITAIGQRRDTNKLRYWYILIPYCATHPFR
jgi:hypothetical protein